MSPYTEGQTHQLMDKLEKEGFTPDHITKLGQFKNLKTIKSVLDGLAKIELVANDVSRIITINDTTIVADLGATPKLPFNGAKVEQHIGEGWVVVERRDDGLYVNNRKVVLHLSRRQQNGKWLTGYELREELVNKPVLNANLLDALYGNRYLIPEDWKKDEQGNIRHICFWASVYRRADGSLCVRSLYFYGGAWYRSYDWLDDDWLGSHPVALLVS